MSIVTILRDKLASGMLHILVPKVPGDSHRRVLVIGSRLWEEIESEPRDSAWEVRIGQLKADLENFVISEQIRPSYLFRLYPRADAVWEIRSVEEDPSIRVFGLFVEKDVFLATNYALRSELKEWESREWKQARRNSIVEWNGLMHQFQPMRGDDIHAFVSGAIDGKYWKD